MSYESDLLTTLSALETSAPAGYALALHIKFTSPTILLQTYPKTWTDFYSQKGLVMSDPTVAWGFENEGTKRWSDLAENDAAGVLALSAEHGLAFGAVCAIETNASRSLCSCARADREFGDDEIAVFAEHVKTLHTLTADLDRFSPQTLVALKSMSVRVTQSDQA